MATIMTTSTCKRCGQEKPLEEFLNNRHGVSQVCRECARKKRHETIAKRYVAQRASSLADYTPRELISELKRRGYEGTITFTETHVIDISKI